MKESKLYEKYSLLLGKIFESNEVYGAMYPKPFPTDWVKPSGMKVDGYSNTVPTMLSSMDMIKEGLI